MIKLGDKVKLLVPHWKFSQNFQYIVTNIHATTDSIGGKYELIYHIRENKEDRYEFCFNEKELKVIE